MRKNQVTRILSLTLLAAGLLTAVAHAQEIVVRSGNGNIGEDDSRITYTTSSRSGPLSNSAFTSSDFSAARNGAPARIVAPYPTWHAVMTDPDAKWLAVDDVLSGHSALYAIQFEVEMRCWDSAMLEFNFAVDDLLGDRSGEANEPGVYLNEMPLASTTGGTDDDVEQTFLVDVTNHIRTGTNTLYVYQRDTGGVAAGTIFSANLNITPIAAPTFLSEVLTSNRSNAMPNDTLQVVATYDGTLGNPMLHLEFQHSIRGDKTWITLGPLEVRGTKINTFEYDLCGWVPTCNCQITGTIPNGVVDGIAFGLFWKDRKGGYHVLKSKDSRASTRANFEGASPVTYDDARWDSKLPQLAGCSACRHQARMTLYGAQLLGDGFYSLCCPQLAFNPSPKK